VGGSSELMRSPSEISSSRPVGPAVTAGNKLGEEAVVAWPECGGSSETSLSRT
jgi:hypothetical protein